MIELVHVLWIISRLNLPICDIPVVDWDRFSSANRYLIVLWLLPMHVLDLVHLLILSYIDWYDYLWFLIPLLMYHIPLELHDVRYFHWRVLYWFVLIDDSILFWYEWFHLEDYWREWEEEEKVRSWITLIEWNLFLEWDDRIRVVFHSVVVEVENIDQ